MFISKTLDKQKKEIIHTWIAGQSSCTLNIPMIEHSILHSSSENKVGGIAI
jgi:hypothetical protein